MISETALARARVRIAQLLACVTIALLGATVAACGTSAASSGDSGPSGSSGTPASNSSSAPSSTTSNGTTTSGRAAPIIYTPPGFSASGAKLPLVIVLHGDGGSPSAMVMLTHFNRIAAQNNFVVAYLGSANGGVDAWLNPTDLPYLSSEITSLTSRYNIDPSRVYVTGFSAGGYMSYVAACALSNQVAAVAPVAVTMNQRVYNSCHPHRPISIMIMAGSSDGARFWGKAGRLPSVFQTAAHWRALDGCPPSDSVVTGRVASVSWQAWSGCANGSSVELYDVVGGTHQWPGSSGVNAASANPDANIDASATIWAFFSQHVAAPLKSADANILGAGVHAAGKTRTIVAKFRLGEPVHIFFKLTQRGKAVFRQKVIAQPKAYVRVVVNLPRKLARGGYILTIGITDAYGRTATLTQKVKVPSGR
jgi:polyhydroxybutyrate depolymerase